MKIRPLQDRILVKRLASEEKTAGGLFIPDNAKEKPMEGLVVAVGNGKRVEGASALQKPDVQVGDSVLFTKYAGSEVKIDGIEHLIMREDDLLGVLVK
jgi:chaperonin GroES